ncbi:MAG: YARHG domain-containing protein [Ignavibacteria bacterium]|nr:YARHG domain-containing protein [Ignavibacteria bacterium]
MNKYLVFLIAFLISTSGCDKVFKDKESENKSETKTEQSTVAKNEAESSELTKKEEELKKKELELKEEELRIKEEELQKRKEETRTTRRYTDGVPGDYPEGSTRYLTYSDIAGKSRWELSVMRNEIYARHGYIFRKNLAIRNHFMKKSWYYPQYYNVDHLLSDIERYNVEFIKSYE